MYHYVKRFVKRPVHLPAPNKGEGIKRSHRRKGYFPHIVYDKKWFRDGEKRFAEFLSARFMVISLGEAPPDRTSLYKAFHRNKRKAAARFLVNVIDAVDGLARRQYEATIHTKESRPAL